MIKLVFFGSGEFPVPIIKKLAKSNKIQIAGIITGGSATPADNPVISISEKLGIKNFPLKNVNTQGIEILQSLKPDLNLVCNYGQFLSKKIFEFPKHKSLNIHASLLPKLRGACPIEMAILQGLKKTGISIQVMEEEMDVGDIIFQKEISISRRETGGSLRRKLQALSVKDIEQVLVEWVEGEIRPMKQDHSAATYCYREDISKAAARIDWSNNADLIERQIRAFNPRPTAWTMLTIDKTQKRVKVIEASKTNQSCHDNPGKTEIVNDKLLVQTKDNYISIDQLQLEGKEPMSAEEFLRGIKTDIQFS